MVRVRQVGDVEQRNPNNEVFTEQTAQPRNKNGVPVKGRRREVNET